MADIGQEDRLRAVRFVGFLAGLLEQSLRARADLQIGLELGRERLRALHRERHDEAQGAAEGEHEQGSPTEQRDRELLGRPDPDRPFVVGKMERELGPVSERRARRRRFRIKKLSGVDPPAVVNLERKMGVPEAQPVRDLAEKVIGPEAPVDEADEGPASLIDRIDRLAFAVTRNEDQEGVRGARVGRIDGQDARGRHGNPQIASPVHGAASLRTSGKVDAEDARRGDVDSLDVANDVELVPVRVEPAERLVEPCFFAVALRFPAADARHVA